MYESELQWGRWGWGRRGAGFCGRAAAPPVPSPHAAVLFSWQLSRPPLCRLVIPGRFVQHFRDIQEELKVK